MTSINRPDSVRLSKDAQATRPAGVTPSWIPPVLKRFYDFTKKWSEAFGNELGDENRAKKEDEMIKAVARNFKGQL
jgi:hypothetical protein